MANRYKVSEVEDGTDARDPADIARILNRHYDVTLKRLRYLQNPDELETERPSFMVVHSNPSPR